MYEAYWKLIGEYLGNLDYFTHGWRVMSEDSYNVFLTDQEPNFNEDPNGWYEWYLRQQNKLPFDDGLVHHYPDAIETTCRPCSTDILLYNDHNPTLKYPWKME